MKRTTAILLLAGLFLLTAAAAAFAAEATEAMPEKMSIAFALGSALCITIAAVGGAHAQGVSIRAAMDAIARNPGASGKIMTPMIIGLAMIESLVIYALVVALILVFKI